MARKGQSAKTPRGQFNIGQDLEIGDEVEFIRGGRPVKGTVVDTIDRAGSVRFVHIEGPQGGRYTLETGGMNANEPHATLYHTPDGYFASTQDKFERVDAKSLSYNRLEVTG